MQLFAKNLAVVPNFAKAMGGIEVENFFNEKLTLLRIKKLPDYGGYYADILVSQVCLQVIDKYLYVLITIMLHHCKKRNIEVHSVSLSLESKLKEKFEQINKTFLDRHRLLLERQVGERTLCGALMLEISKALENSWYFCYFADVEYNRDVNMIKYLPKKHINNDCLGEQIRIFPDIIVHSRGQRELDNLIVIEMQKADAKEAWKNTDRQRLELLTDQNGAFKYRLGIFYIVDFKNKQVQLEYYVNGEHVEQGCAGFAG